MKTIRHIILALYCLAYMALGQTAPMTLGWDGTAPRYEVWSGMNRLATVTKAQADLQLPVDRLSKLTVTAIYPPATILKDPVRIDSEPFVVQPVPIQFGDDLVKWENVPVIFRPFSTKLFLRAAFITR